jgi:hypothetical protein
LGRGSDPLVRLICPRYRAKATPRRKVTQNQEFECGID